MTATLTTAELANELDTTPRELRKFLRSDEGPGKVGKGSRYVLPGTKREIAALKKSFIAWQGEVKESPDASTDD